MTLTCCVNNNSLNSQRNVDPTRTFSLRKRFEAILETFYAFDGRSKESFWMNIYILSAYQRGVLRAAAELKKRGIPYLFLSLEEIFMSPFHADAVALLYTRSFNELKGITDEMDKQISRVLAEGLANGENPRKIAYDIVDRVDKIGITRARG